MIDFFNIAKKQAYDEYASLVAVFTVIFIVGISFALILLNSSLAFTDMLKDELNRTNQYIIIIMGIVTFITILLTIFLSGIGLYYENKYGNLSMLRESCCILQFHYKERTKINLVLSEIINNHNQKFDDVILFEILRSKLNQYIETCSSEQLQFIKDNLKTIAKQYPNIDNMIRKKEQNELEVKKFSIQTKIKHLENMIR